METTHPSRATKTPGATGAQPGHAPTEVERHTSGPRSVGEERGCPDGSAPRFVRPLPVHHLRLVEPGAVDLYASLADRQRDQRLNPPPSWLEIAVATIGVVAFVCFVMALDGGLIR